MMTNKLYKIRLKTGDTVMVRSGKHKGRTGKVLAVHPSLNKVTVEGINVVKRARKPTSARPQGGIEELTRPIFVSKVGILDAAGKRPSRVVYKVAKTGEKSRMLSTSGKEIK